MIDLNNVLSLILYSASEFAFVPALLFAFDCAFLLFLFMPSTFDPVIALSFFLLFFSEIVIDPTLLLHFAFNIAFDSSLLRSTFELLFNPALSHSMFDLAFDPALLHSIFELVVAPRFIFFRLLRLVLHPQDELPGAAPDPLLLSFHFQTFSIIALD